MLTLPTPPNFSLASVVRSHGWVQMLPFEEMDEGRSFLYTDTLSNGQAVFYRVRAVTGALRVELSEALDEPAQAEVSAHLRWMLALDGFAPDFTEFYTLARQEPKLAKAVERQAGRVLRCPTLFEDVLKTLMTTNTLWAHTKRMCRELVSNYGQPTGCESGRRAFPTPQRLAVLEEAELRQVARLGYRAPYVLALARRVAGGELDLEVLKTSALPTPELRKALMQIKGVGGYAAANLLMLLGRYDYLPVDSWALKMVSQEFHGGARIGPAEVEAAFAAWGKFKGLAYWFWEWGKSDQ